MEKLINHVVCTPTTNHTCCCTTSLTVITLKDCLCYVSVMISCHVIRGDLSSICM